MMGILQRSSRWPAQPETPQQRVWTVPKQGSSDGRQEENPRTWSSLSPEGVLPSTYFCVSSGARRKAVNSSWVPVGCAGAVPMASAWKLARGHGNPRELIPAGSSHPYIALPSLAGAACSASLPCWHCWRGMGSSGQRGQGC